MVLSLKEIEIMKTSHLLACTVALSNVSLAGYAEMGIGQSKSAPSSIDCS